MIALRKIDKNITLKSDLNRTALKAVLRDMNPNKIYSIIFSSNRDNNNLPDQLKTLLENLRNLPYSNVEQVIVKSNGNSSPRALRNVFGKSKLTNKMVLTTN